MCISLNKSRGQFDSGRFEFSLKTANPAAQHLMKEDFYWSPIEETGPFGSDDGSDAAYGFRDWRTSHPTSTPMSYLKDLIARWDYPYIALDEMDTVAVSKYLKASSQNMGIRFLVGIDNAIIGTGYAQFVLEGKIDSSLKALSEIAIKRELMEILLTHFGMDYRDRRKSILKKMLSVVEKMPV